jgi:tyrosinase
MKTLSDLNAVTTGHSRKSLVSLFYYMPKLNLYSYWYEQRDAGNFKSSVIFDATYGFGGDGSGNRGCITTGPFVNYTNRLGPGYAVTDHCIDRRISEQMSQGSTQREVDACLAKKDFVSAWPCIEAMPHSGGHAGVGGQVRPSNFLI